MASLRELVISKEPALAASSAGAVVAYVLGLLVTRGVITSTDASTLTQQVAPAAAAVLTLALGVVTRHFVHSPASVDALVAAVLPSDAPSGDIDDHSDISDLAAAPTWQGPPAGTPVAPSGE